MNSGVILTYCKELRLLLFNNALIVGFKILFAVDRYTIYNEVVSQDLATSL